MCAKPTKPRWADGNASYATEPSSGKKDTGWLSGEKPPFQYMNWLFLKNNEWITFFENQTAALSFVSIESNDPATWNGSSLTFSSDMVFRFREEAGALRINKIAAGSISLTDGQVVVARFDRTNASPVTLSLQATYASMVEGEYGVFAESSLDLNNIDLETILFARRDFTHGDLGAEQVLQVVPYGTRHFKGSKFDLGNSGDLRKRSLGFENLTIQRGTTTNANDSILITGDGGAALSETNPGYVTMLDNNRNVDTYKVTADVKINMTGCHFGFGGKGDLSSVILRVVAVNNSNTSLKWGVVFTGGRLSIDSTLTSATQTSITSSEDMLVNTALDVAIHSIQEMGFARAAFDDTGGAAEDLYAFGGGGEDLRLGSADGQWQDFNPTYTGFSANPTSSVAKWTSYGRTAHVMFVKGTNGTSNTTTFTLNGPVKSKDDANGSISTLVDNGVAARGNGSWNLSASSSSFTLFTVNTTWTGSGSKAADFNSVYEML